MNRQKARILFLVLEMDFGGLQRIVNQLIRHIDHVIFEPYLVCLDRGGIFYDETAAACNEAFVLGRSPGLFDLKLLFKLLGFLKDKSIDIIHSHNGCSLYSAIAGRKAGVKGIIHTDHGRLVPDKKSAIFEDRLSSCMMDRFVGVSAELSEYLHSTVGISGSKLTTVINGVDTQTFRPRDTADRKRLRDHLGFGEIDQIIGTVCRLDPIKNLTFMISCMHTIVSTVPQAKLVVVGDGPIKDSLLQQVQSLRLSSRVMFLGSRQNIDEILPAFDIYASTSLSEGTSMTILEAMATGLPIVASAVGGNLRLVNDSNGMLYPLGDADRFCKETVELLLNQNMRQAKGNVSREKVIKDFGLSLMVRKYEELYLSFMPDEYC